MFGLDVLVVAPKREPRRALQSSFGSVGEGEIADVAGAFNGDGLGDFDSARVERGAGGHQRPRRPALLVGDDPEKKMLGANVPVAETPGLLLGKNDEPARSIAE